MTHHPTSEELFAFRDGELGLEKRGLIEAHVVSCSACQSWLDGMSDAEGMLRQQRPEPDESYFDTLTRSVMARVAPATQDAPRKTPAPAAVPKAAGDRAAETPRVRPGRRRSLDDEPRGRAPRLPWPAIISAVSAAAAVVVVVVLLFQRQDAWRHAPSPAGIGLGKDAVRETKEEAPTSQAPADERVAAEPPAQADEGVAAKLETAPKSQEERAPVAPSPGEATAANRPEPEIRSQNAEDAMPELALQKAAAVAPAKDAEGLRSRAGAEPQAAAGNTGVAEESAFAPLAARYGLPTLYDPSTVPSDALLRAEPEIRFLYQSGRAGADSARVRLYLAEAARTRAGDSPDTETYDTIVHHYQRVVRLARDPETARMARERLEDFVSRNAPSR